MIKQHYYSAFWLAYGNYEVELSPEWYEEAIPLSQWLAMGDAERNDIVLSYAYRRPPERSVLNDRKRVAV